MKKTYIIKANSYQDAIRKIQKMKRDADFNSEDHDNLEEASSKLDKALQLIRDAGRAVDRVKAPIKATEEDYNTAMDGVEAFKNAVDSDIGFEVKYGNKR